MGEDGRDNSSLFLKAHLAGLPALSHRLRQPRMLWSFRKKQVFQALVGQRPADGTSPAATAGIDVGTPLASPFLGAHRTTAHRAVGALRPTTEKASCEATGGQVSYYRCVSEHRCPCAGRDCRAKTSHIPLATDLGPRWVPTGPALAAASPAPAAARPCSARLYTTPPDR